jgi:hypothetical protein
MVEKLETALKIRRIMQVLGVSFSCLTNKRQSNALTDALPALGRNPRLTVPDGS